MKFCNTEVESRFFLAPMAGVTDPPFRTVCEEYGAALTYTEMVSAKALTYKDQKSASMLALPQKRKPCFVQIFGSEPDVMPGAHVLLLRSREPRELTSIWDALCTRSWATARAAL